MKYRAFILLLSFLPAVHAYAQADSLTVIGTVVNGVDDNVLPLCKVHLIKDGICWASGISDYDGNYSLPPVVAGDYTFLVTQFGDTLMCVKGLRLSRNTMVRSVIQPPTGGFSTLPTIAVGGLVPLRPVSVKARRNLLYGMGLMITNPNDNRLWNFSGQMDPFFEDKDISFWYRRYKLFYKLKAMGYNITSPFELIYPEVYHPASDSNAVDYNFWFLGLKF